MSTGPIRIFLIDEHQLMLEALQARFASLPEIDVVGIARNAEVAENLLTETRPDVVVLDVVMPGRSPFELVSQSRQLLPATKFLFLSAHQSDVLLSQAVRCGASGYLLKGETVSILVEGIQQVFRGNQFYSADLLQRLEFDPVDQNYRLRPDHPLGQLTDRQLQVLCHLARGESVKEVAKAMHLSQKSIDSHKYRIMHKLGIHDRVELARLAIREGLTLP